MTDLRSGREVSGSATVLTGIEACGPGHYRRSIHERTGE
jgi:hypothetical protein